MFGQYSQMPGSGNRYTMAEYRRVYRAGTIRRPRTCTPHNRIVQTLEDGTVRFVLHDTAVVTRHPDGSITLDDGGWRTMTTRRAMMEGLCELVGIHVGIYGDQTATTDHVMAGTRFSCPYTFRPLEK